MIWTLVAILLVLWLLSVITSYTVSGLAHLLLIVALVLIVWRFVSGPRAV